MMPERTAISGADVQDQVTLPLRVAMGICLRGIRTRLGRSAITLSGVGLGIAFLMAVLSSFHVKRAMTTEAAKARDVERRLAALRSEIGSLKGKAFRVAAAQPSEADTAFLHALASAGAEVRRGEPSETSAVLSGTLLLGDYEPLLAAAAPAERIFVFRRPTAADARLRYLGIELRPEELAQAARRERQAESRMYWIVVVSLLITVGCIANAMLMSVTERFREIGTMKCLGALSSFVVKLFLIESLLLGLVGAVLGSLLGVAFTLAAYSYTFGLHKVFAAVDIAVLGSYGLLCVVAGVVLAVLAAIYPARVAAKMMPAAALASHV